MVAQRDSELMLFEPTQLNLLIDVPYVQLEYDEDLPVCNEKRIELEKYVVDENKIN